MYLEIEHVGNYFKQCLITSLFWNKAQRILTETHSCALSHKKSSTTDTAVVSVVSLRNSDSFDLVSLSFECDLNCHKNITSIVIFVVKNTLSPLLLSEKFLLYEPAIAVHFPNQAQHRILFPYLENFVSLYCSHSKYKMTHCLTSNLSTLNSVSDNSPKK